MLNTTPLRAVLCAAAVLLATACGGGHGHGPEQLGEMIADTVRSSVRGEGPGLGVPDTAFDPARYLCVPAVDGRTARLWRTEAPRTAADGPVELGVLAPEDADTRSVTVSVIGPRGGTAATEAAVSPGEWTRVRYPDDFEGAGGDPSAGVHTVVWSDTGSGTPLTCDGFEAV
ncbi:hypothetical protein MRI28_13575 [Nocardiopsis dassonvillei]|uniref:hypothetical protein n=1 Tax=Nocardiopsis dassonvillei TaxID=2014 RepID=UPI00200FE2B1|nr:hypothetical protein [Nocardiopsis dassonvillei]MCK9870654.1 hypothetical protein [Nocardiopsis dassonvillei]